MKMLIFVPWRLTVTFINMKKVMSEYQLELWESSVVLETDWVTYAEDPKRVEWMASACLCLGGNYVKAEGCMWSSVALDFPLVLAGHFVLDCWSTEGAVAENLLLKAAAQIAWFFSGLAHFVVTCSPDVAELMHSLCVANTCSSKASGSQWAGQLGRMRMGRLKSRKARGQQYARYLVTLRSVLAAGAFSTAINTQPLPSPPWEQLGNLWCTTRTPGHVPYGTTLACCPLVSLQPGISLAVSLGALCEAFSQPTCPWEVKLSEDAHGLISQLSVLLGLLPLSLLPR